MTEEELGLLLSFARSLGAELNDGQVAQFNRYLSLLLDWNNRINLTAITTPIAIVVRHFCDSISCTAVMDSLHGSKLVDVGSGAGFPGIPLKILFPGIWLTLVESTKKKAAFLKVVAGELQLTKVEIVNQRAEVVGQSAQFRGRYDYAAARSVARTAVLMEYLLPLVAAGGMAVAMKGNQVDEEVTEAAAAISILGGSDAYIQKIKLPEYTETEGHDQTTTIEHSLVTVTKVGSTPDRYPRRTGIPTKRPLGYDSKS